MVCFDTTPSACYVFIIGVYVTIVQAIEINPEGSCEHEVEDTLRVLLNPDNNSLQVQSLRRDLLRRLQEALEELELEDQKRSLASLAAWNNFPEQKRSLEALARAGYMKTHEDEEDEDANYKRSIAHLAKNGQLPMPPDEQKRGIEALARNGDLHPRRAFQDPMEAFHDKRNIGSLARSYNFPLTSYNSGKRSVSSLARNGELPYALKRSVSSLAREGQLRGKRNLPDKIFDVDKRNLQSLKAQKPRPKRSTNATRTKRQIDYSDQDPNLEYPTTAYQNENNFYDYEDLLQELGANYPPEKRFLGRLPQMGKPKTTPFPKTRRYH